MKPFFAMLRLMIRAGTLVMIDAAGVRHVFSGTGSPGWGHSDIVTMRLHDPRLHWRLVTEPGVAIGEAFMDGTLTLEDGTSLERLLTILMGNLSTACSGGVFGLVDTMSRLMRRWLAFNPAERSRRNVAHHYDLSDDLFSLFLDPDRQYSCAFFRKPADTLEQAQANKKEIIARKLIMKPGLRVLDIGSGWGGLGLSLAKEYGADVTGVTLSRGQLAASTARANAASLENSCRFALRDYRHEPGPYDRIVSIGMFEHVGLHHYSTFFRHVAEMLSHDGVALIHSIGTFERPGPSPKWIERYIFPGGYVPTLSQVLTAVERTRRVVTDIEIWRLHYAETLRHWRIRFLANREKAKVLYDERFCRMWEFYLTCCEVAFRIVDLMVFQLQLAKHQGAVPLTRDYLWADLRPGSMTEMPRARTG